MFRACMALALVLPLLSQAQQPLAIENVTVIDVVSARPLSSMTVVTKGSDIVAVGPVATVKVPRGAKRIDGSGKFLIPGLWDMHTHFTADHSSLDLFVAHGVLGVRDMGSVAVRRKGATVEYLPRYDAIQLILDTRNRINAGRLLGPTIYTAGMIITGPNPRNPNAPAAPHQIVVKTPAQARLTVDKLEFSGVDFIKVHARLSKECFHATVDEAKKLGLTVAGHVPTSLDPIEVSRAGVKSIEHLTGVWEYAHQGLPDSDQGMDPKRFQDEIEEFKKNRTWQVPTLVNFQAGAEGYRIVNHPETEAALRYVVPELALRWMGDWSKSDFTPQMVKDFNDSVVTLQGMTLQLVKAGVPVMAGTDCGGIFTYPGISLHKELELLNKGGLSPMQTLQAATIRPAQFLGIDSRAGSVSKGKVADLVLLSGNPLADIKNTDAIDTVILHGRVIDRRRLLARVAARAKPTVGIMRSGHWGG